MGSSVYGGWCMEKEMGRYTAYQLCHHMFISYLHIGYITPDSDTLGCPLVGLHWADSMGMTRGNDIGEVSGIGQKVRHWLAVTCPC